MTIASFDTNTTEGKVKLFNGKNATDGALKDILDQEVLLQDVLIHSDSRTDPETGEVISSEITVLYTDKGVFGGNSGVLMNTAKDVIPLLEALGEPIGIQVFESKSKNGRGFYNFRLTK